RLRAQAGGAAGDPDPRTDRGDPREEGGGPRPLEGEGGAPRRRADNAREPAPSRPCPAARRQAGGRRTSARHAIDAGVIRAGGRAAAGTSPSVRADVSLLGERRSDFSNRSAVTSELHVGGEERDFFDKRLGDQKAIEG